MLGGSGDAEGRPGGSAAPDPSFDETPADPTSAGVKVLRRLSGREYLNTVRDLLGDTTLHLNDVPVENDDPVLAYHLPGPIDKLNAELFRDAAEKLAANAAPRLSALVPCDAQSAGEEQCARKFVTEFGLKAYRRPVSADEADALMRLYQTGRTEIELDFNGAIVLLIEAMLQSRGFLYHWENGPAPAIVEGATVKLDGYAVASRLSYFLWGTMPDQALLDAAATDRLASAEDVAREARRMLGDARARDAVADFFDDWLDISSSARKPKDPDLYPEFGDPLKRAMVEEVRRFVAGVVFDGSGRLEEVLTGTSSFANGPLAAVYGVGGPTGDEMQPVSLDPTQRSGVLTSPAFLTVTGAAGGSHPVRRGKAILYQLLCQTLPPPPNDIPEPKRPDEGGTTRERFAEHSQLACAKGCHAFLDPLGFPFESYDGIGRFRTTDNGEPVDATSTVELDGQVHAVADARGLSQVLASSETVHSCFSKQWLRYALGRGETGDDKASFESVVDAFEGADQDIRELMVALVSSRTFRFRAIMEGEVLQ
ncbi:hypothetical protein BE20_25495 [Sorangium cellulosum]|uniref:DUF1592 domain-containing protein n=1 Tax=Sorangium cellulosum TaxID=56 RepID=A0A150RDC2_SORCE|nr:hypothetical protein BE18_12080 [Sorangium cellulosum]KYF87605.1 hypothetical protein BE20_25495 [Sorangium cellulosum]